MIIIVSNQSGVFRTNSKMCALTPPVFASFEWPVSHQQQQDYSYRNTQNIVESPYFLPISPSETQLDGSASFSGKRREHTTEKKLCHNASERDRRKKINSLYSYLRSLLPAADQTNKLSIPATVSRVVKYLPELQQQVEGLVQKKEALLSKISSQDNLIVHRRNQRQITVGSSFFSISASPLTDKEIFIHISTCKAHNCPLSEILLHLEEDGLLLMNASSFESVGGRVFHNLHLQAERTYKLDCEIISEKLKSWYLKKEEEQLYPSNFGCKN